MKNGYLKWIVYERPTNLLLMTAVEISTCAMGISSLFIRMISEPNAPKISKDFGLGQKIRRRT